MYKAIFIFALLPVIGLMFLSCDEAASVLNPETIDKTKLVPPLGLHSVTGNQNISLFWYTSNYEDDLDGYFVYRATGDYTNQSSDSSLSIAFTRVDSIPATAPVDAVMSRMITGLTNGTTYSFAIVAFADEGKKISYPSNVIKDTPRPDINSISLKSASTGQVTGDDTQAGFDFNTFTVVEVPAAGYTSANGADIINEAFDPGRGANIRAWLAGMNGGGLQDLGYMADLDGADVAPPQGYSAEGSSIAVLAGHVYAVKTGDNHYGKLIITNIGGAPDYPIRFNAAFQTQQGNPNYKAQETGFSLGIH
ncbi:hypothetical protein JXO59_00735 [candidate division KSB1 bacterium]|nr:hypothetical protein [candidate division KSB1 bacterium]